MLIEKNKVVAVLYELRMDSKDGDVVEKVTEERPMTFLFGAGNLIEAFETHLSGKKAGDAFEFGIESANAYGDYRAEAVVDLPKEIFQAEDAKPEELLKIGNYIDMHDDKGTVHKGKVMEVADEKVKMDFNHPMAGKDLFFKGEVAEVREASADEMSHGHVHGPGGVDH